jgi:hypothetical protein
MPKEKEVVTKIVDYVEKNLKKGYKLEELKWALINQKYSKIEIDKAIAIISARTAKSQQEQRAREVQTAMIVDEEKPVVKKVGFFKKMIGKLKNN